MKLNNQTIYFKSSENMEEIPDKSIVLIVTSPPYWNAKNYNVEDQIGFGQSYKQYIESLNRVWNECIRVLQPNGKIAINVQPLPINNEISGFNRRIIKNIMSDIEKFMTKSELYLNCMFYWDKSKYMNTTAWGSYPNPTNIQSNTSFEQIFVWGKKGTTRKIDKLIMEKSKLTKEEFKNWVMHPFWQDIKPVIKINRKKENTFGHPAPFPDDIPYRIIKMNTVEGEKVLDPFLGSGTTLKICEKLNRKGYGYEINDGYYTLIKKRIQEPLKIGETYSKRNINVKQLI